MMKRVAWFPATPFIYLALIMGSPDGALGQAWTWPERAENLTELPADFPPNGSAP